jgi:hypothetical protein
MSTVMMANAMGDQSCPMTAHGFIAVLRAAVLVTRIQADRPSMIRPRNRRDIVVRL